MAHGHLGPFISYVLYRFDVLYDLVVSFIYSIVSHISPAHYPSPLFDGSDAGLAICLSYLSVIKLRPQRPEKIARLFDYYALLDPASCVGPGERGTESTTGVDGVELSYNTPGSHPRLSGSGSFHDSPELCGCLLSIFF